MRIPSGFHYAITDCNLVKSRRGFHVVAVDIFMSRSSMEADKLISVMHLTVPINMTANEAVTVAIVCLVCTAR